MKTVKPQTKKKSIIGWREWFCLKDLGVPAIKAKIDTGAKTSALHAYELESYRRKGKLFVRFYVHPLQKNNDIVVACHAKVIDRRKITSSTGHHEYRYVIASRCQLGHHKETLNIEITLTNRDIMTYRMLLGRDALLKGMLVDPKKSFYFGNISKDEISQIYP